MNILKNLYKTIKSKSAEDDDISILRSDSTFLLLKKLAYYDDIEAIEELKDEINQRMRVGDERIINSVLTDGYFDFLSRKEKRNIYYTNRDKINTLALSQLKTPSLDISLPTLLSRFCYPRELAEIFPEEPEEVDDLSVYQLQSLAYIKARSGCYESIFPLLYKWRELFVSKLVSEFAYHLRRVSLSYNLELVRHYNLSLFLLRFYFPLKTIRLQFKELLKILRSHNQYSGWSITSEGLFSYSLYKDEDDIICLLDTEETFKQGLLCTYDFRDLSYDITGDYRKRVSSIELSLENKDENGCPKLANVNFFDCSAMECDNKFTKLLTKLFCICRSFDEFGDRGEMERYNEIIRDLEEYLCVSTHNDSRKRLFSYLCILDVLLANMYTIRYIDAEEFHNRVYTHYKRQGKRISYKISLAGIMNVSIRSIEENSREEFLISYRLGLDPTEKPLYTIFFQELSEIFFPEMDEKIVGICCVRNQIRINTRRI